MTIEPVLEWRDALRDDLRLAGPAAIRMLSGTLAPDPLVLLPALQAAGLLDQETCGEPDLAALRSTLLGAAYREADRLAAVVEEVDLAVGLLHAEDRIDALHRLVALGGLANALPPGRARRAVEDALACEEADLALADLGDEDLLQVAILISDALDLDADHPLSRVLPLLTAVAQVPGEEAFAAGVRSAEAVLFAPRLEQWAARLSERVRAWVAGLVQQPALALGGAGDLTPIPERRVVAETALEELCLLCVGDELAIEWVGDGPAPTSARLGERALLPLPTLVPGSAIWTLGDPSGDAMVVTLEFPGRALVVDLAGA